MSREAFEKWWDSHGGWYTTKEHAWKAWQAALQSQQGEADDIVYAYRRKGLEDFCTCSEARYNELKSKPTHFEVAVFYRSPPAQAAQPQVSLSSDSLQHQVREIGDMLHNLSCEHQNNEPLSTRLGELAVQAWNIAKEQSDVEQDLTLALEMLAEWAAAVRYNGAGWDDWDWHYKNVMYGKHSLRDRLDVLLTASQEQV